MPFDLLALLQQGYRFEKHGTGYTVTSPEGRTGWGVDHEAAVSNIDAQIIPNSQGLRELHRQDGSVVAIDQGSETPAVDSSADSVAVTE